VIAKAIATVFTSGTLLLAEAPLPAPGANELFSWLSCGCAVMGIIALAKVTFFKHPPDHKRFADKVDTDKRFEALEVRLNEIDGKVDGIPHRTIALLTDASNLFPRGGAPRR
jgi:hypothetical protein